MSINTYLSTTESKKQTKQTENRDRVIATESFLIMPGGRGFMGEWVKKYGDMG